MANQKPLFWLIILTSGLSLLAISFFRNDALAPTKEPGISSSPVVFSPVPSPTPTPPSPTPGVKKIQLPAVSAGPGSFINEPVPWSLLSAKASCQLKGEIKFLTDQIYDNQDALFVYRGIDHPARNVIWFISPEDDLSVGPNLFVGIPIPDGESLLGITLPENPSTKRYELTAEINYGRLVDGNVKVMTKECEGKTTVVLP